MPVVPGEVAWRDEHGLVHSAKTEAIWVTCGMPIVAMVDIADGEPTSCLRCLVGDEWVERISDRLAMVMGIPKKYLGIE